MVAFAAFEAKLGGNLQLLFVAIRHAPESIRGSIPAQCGFFAVDLVPLPAIGRRGVQVEQGGDAAVELVVDGACVVGGRGATLGCTRGGRAHRLIDSNRSDDASRLTEKRAQAIGVVRAERAENASSPLRLR